MIKFAYFVAVFFVFLKHEMSLAAGALKRTCLTIFTCKRHKRPAAGEDLAPWRLKIKIAYVRHMQIIFAIIFCIYPALCAKVFLVFKCERYGDRAFLWSDNSVLCYEINPDGSHNFSNPEYLTFRYLSGIFMVVYVLGIPLTLFCLLYVNRKKIMKDPDNPALKARYGSLYHQYEPQYWYFELVQMFRKMVLTGLLMAVTPGTPVQVMVGIIVCFGYLVLWINTKPYVFQEEDMLEQVAAIQLFVSLLLGLNLRYKEALDTSRKLAKGVYEPTPEDKYLDFLLVFLNTVVIIVGVVTVLLSLGFAKKAIKKFQQKAKEKKALKEKEKLEKQKGNPSSKGKKNAKIAPVSEDDLKPKNPQEKPQNGPVPIVAQSPTVPVANPSVIPTPTVPVVPVPVPATGPVMPPVSSAAVQKPPADGRPVSAPRDPKDMQTMAL